MEHIRCNLCGEDDTRALFSGRDLLHHTTPDSFFIVQCKNCGLTYMNPQPDAIELAGYYPDEYSVYSRDGSRPTKDSYILSGLRRLSRVLGIKRNINQHRTSEALNGGDTTAKTFLDIGCGNGRRLAQMHASHPNWKLYGLDIDKRACEVASSNGFTVHCGDIFSAKYAENQFDIITMDHVLEHLKDPSEALTEIRRVLKPGGSLLITVPNWGSIWAKIFKSNWFHLDVPRHLFFFTEKTLSEMLKKSGFRVKDVRFKGDPKDILNHFSYLFFGRIPKYKDLLLIEIFRPINTFAEKKRVADVIQINSVKD